jgi:hypothetical protein
MTTHPLARPIDMTDRDLILRLTGQLHEAIILIRDMECDHAFMSRDDREMLGIMEDALDSGRARLRHTQEQYDEAAREAQRQLRLMLEERQATGSPT